LRASGAEPPQALQDVFRDKRLDAFLLPLGRGSLLDAAAEAGDPPAILMPVDSGEILLAKMPLEDEARL
jgi:hypothetical protein